MNQGEVSENYLSNGKSFKIKDNTLDGCSYMLNRTKCYSITFNFDITVVIPFETKSSSECLHFIIPAEAFARDFVITGVGLSVCLPVCYHDN